MDNHDHIYAEIKKALREAAPRGKSAEMHLQLIKYADELKDIPSDVVCDRIGVNQSFRTVVSKMIKIVNRLKAAGLDVSKI